MAFIIHAAQHLQLPGACNIIVEEQPVTGTTTPLALSRIDYTMGYPAQPVRNFDSVGPTGFEKVTDTECPLGRDFYYNLTNSYGDVIASSKVVRCRPPANNRSLLRSVLMPTVVWAEVEAVDEVGVSWATNTSVHRVIGSDSPIVVGEVLTRHQFTISFLCRSIPEADYLVKMARPGWPLLLRHSPCAGVQARDAMFYVIDQVLEKRYGRSGWRIIIMEAQSTPFVPGTTLEPDFAAGWDFQALSDSAPDFATQASLWPSFLIQTLLPLPSWVPRTGPAPERALVTDAW